MNQLLKPSKNIQLQASNMTCEVGRFLGGGGQGEVYEATLGGKPVAVKWYFPHQATVEQRAALERLIKDGAPNGRFLWPLGLVSVPDVDGFGYVMPLRDPKYKSIIDLMKRRIEPSFWALATAGLELAHCFHRLHSKGFCYRDISFGNVFFDPDTGGVLICDNDNVAVEGETSGGILGTPRFMAPEVVRGETLPGTQTDLFSLAVLLFYIFMVHHPLEGKKEAQIKSFDLPAMNKIYGEEPVFIFDPSDKSNRPLNGYHDNAIAFWPIYPEFIKSLFTRAFTAGIHDPDSRVRESEWRAAMVKLRDAVIYCGACGCENFYDIEHLKNSGSLKTCWECGQPITPPPRMRIGKQIVMLNHDTRLFINHIDPNKPDDFSEVAAEVNRHPNDPNIWGLKNLTPEKWVVTYANGDVKDVAPGRSLTISEGAAVNFGPTQGEIRI